MNALTKEQKKHHHLYHSGNTKWICKIWRRKNRRRIKRQLHAARLDYEDCDIVHFTPSDIIPWTWIWPWY